MAVDDISLTASMRANLFRLQGTAELMSRTQTRLSSGKKVNSAIDNPTSFFTAIALNSRADILSGLKDAMGEAVSTVKAADSGIDGIMKLIEHAKSIAQSAQSAPNPAGTEVDTGTVTWTGIQTGDVITIGGVAFTATNSAIPPADQFRVIGTTTAIKQNLANAINNHNWSAAPNTFAASVTGGTLSISSSVTATGAARSVAAGDLVGFSHGSATMQILNPPHAGGTAFDVGSITLTGFAAGDHLQIGNTVFTAVDSSPAAFDKNTHQGQFLVNGNDAYAMQSLANALGHHHRQVGILDTDGENSAIRVMKI